MILEAVVLFAGLTFATLAFGYWMKSKVLMFGGATMMLLLSSLMMLPDAYSGGIDYVSGTQRAVFQNATNVSASETLTNSSITESYTISHVNPAAATLVGLNLLMLSIYIMLAVWFDEKLD